MGVNYNVTKSDDGNRLLGQSLFDSKFNNVMSGLGFGASLWNTYNTMRYQKEAIKEQRRYREMAETDFYDKREARQKTQANFNSIW